MKTGNFKKVRAVLAGLRISQNEFLKLMRPEKNYLNCKRQLKMRMKRTI